MSKIYMDFSEIRKANYVLPYLEMKAESVKRRIDRLKREMPDAVRDSYQISQRLEQVCRSIGGVEYQINQLHEVTNFCVEQYEAAEYENSRNAEAFL